MIIATFDLETTGLKPASCDIIEVGIVCWDDDGHEQARYNELVDIGYSLPQKITHITGITDDDLQEQGLPWARVRQETRKYLGQADVWCAYNADFDVGFLTHHIDGIEVPPVADPFEMATRFYPDDCLEDRTLGTLCHHYGINLAQAHRAVYDAEATANLLFAFMDDFNFTVSDWLGDEPICLGRHHQGEDPFDALYSSRRSCYA